jgi:hypothetical protein
MGCVVDPLLGVGLLKYTARDRRRCKLRLNQNPPSSEFLVPGVRFALPLWGRCRDKGPSKVRAFHAIP